MGELGKVLLAADLPVAAVGIHLPEAVRIEVGTHDESAA
jgi:hypothetical protein